MADFCESNKTPTDLSVSYRFVAQLILQSEERNLLGSDEFHLLEAVEQQGSLTAAAKQAGFSYKKAWLLAERINNLAQSPLLARSKGGVSGGSTELTEAGLHFLSLFRELRQLSERLLAPYNGQPSGAELLMRGLDMKVSARNQFSGKVADLHQGAVYTEVLLELSGGTAMTAMVTHRAAEELKLGPGAEIFAVIKASHILLAEETAKVSTANRLIAQVDQVFDGPVHREISLSLPGGNGLSAMVPSHAEEGPDLSPGGKVLAFFNATDVLLITP